MGHAILDYASPVVIRYNEELEEICGDSDNGYCATGLAGGPFSIHEGVGDLVAFFLFSQFNRFGGAIY